MAQARETTAAGHGNSSRIFHLVQEPLWQDAKRSAEQQYLPPTYDADGFIHATADKDLLLGVANHFYRGVQDTYLCLVIDTGRLSSRVVFEPAMPVGKHDAPQGEQTLFPHIYGPLDVSAVIEELRVVRSEDGTFLQIT